MDRAGGIFLLIFILLIVFVVAIIYCDVKEHHECEARGGVMIKTGEYTVLQPYIVGKVTVLIPHQQSTYACTK